MDYPRHKNTCPAKDKRCNKCSKIGHFAKCCKKKTQSGGNREYHREHQTRRNTRYQKPLNNLATTHSPHDYSSENSDCEYTDETVFTVNPVHNTNDLNTVYDDSEMLYSVCTLFENAEVSRDIEQKEK